MATVDRAAISGMRRNGFAVIHRAFSPTWLYKFYEMRESWDTPVRGHTKSGKYIENPKEPQEWTNYWTESVRDHDMIYAMRQDSLDSIAAEFLTTPIMYAADVSVVAAGSTRVNPHVDTPYRYPQWNNTIESRMLGLQMAIPLQSYEPGNGITGFLPGSHVRSWDIQKCYAGEYTEKFLDGVYQPRVDFGDAVIWDTRTLHSHMPNTSQIGRHRFMLLLNYLEDDIVDEVADYEVSLSFV